MDASTADGRAGLATSPVDLSADRLVEPLSSRQDSSDQRRLPLTSLDDTPENAATIAFVLGAAFAGGIAVLASETRRAPLGGYVAVVAVFHVLEYVVTATYNPSRVTVACECSHLLTPAYLLDNGQAYWLAHALGAAEFVVETWLLSPPWRAVRATRWLRFAGVSAIVFGQIIRTAAMVVAGTSFTHALSQRRQPDHVLVRDGVYRWSRHPSYCGFFWWAVGTQLWLGNPIGVAGFAAVLWRFFSRRIRVEEAYLERFFGPAYISYRAHTPTRIPLIP